jgi:uncharacterized protein (UPF0264 family)
VTQLLASVRDEDEALTALGGRADIIDFKDPDAGALGALDTSVIAGALRRLKGRAQTSATAGDLPLDPATLVAAVERTGATGVDFVKIGLLPGPQCDECIAAMATSAGRYRLVCVFFADRGVPLPALPRLARAGFAGVMIDTFDKAGGGLRRHLDEGTLRAFVGHAQANGLFAGLAGSLVPVDIAPLAALHPDYLGFRGALCEGGRGARLSAARLATVRGLLDQAQPPAPALSPK